MFAHMRPRDPVDDAAAICRSFAMDPIATPSEERAMPGNPSVEPAMFEPILGYSDEELAYHEAGHAVVSYLLKDILPPPVWVTIERTGTIGGSFQIEQDINCDATEWVALCWAGIAAQIEFNFRSCGQVCPPESWAATAKQRGEFQWANRYDQRYSVLGRADIDLIHKMFSQIESSQWDQYWSHGTMLSNHIILKEWAKVQKVAADLLANKTLVGKEAYMCLEALEEGNDRLEHVLRAYRAGRKDAPPPKGWNGRGRWYETVDAWLERNRDQEAEPRESAGD